MSNKRDTQLRKIGHAEREERAKGRRERNRKAHEAKRRARGVRTRAEYEAQSVSRAKPWLALGISRTTWYRRALIRLVL
jgi:hypothetical protein